MSKSKIKSRKERMIDYDSKYMDIPKDDPVERVMYCLGDKLTEKVVREIIAEKEKILSNMTYSSIKLIYYEYPMASNRPRHRNMGGFVSSYVPNAKENKEYFEKLISKIQKTMSIIHTPIYVKLHSYFEMPTGATVKEKVLFEAKIAEIVPLRDIDNVFKCYTDSMIAQLITNDNIIYKTNIESYYSFLPRIELTLFYSDFFSTKFIYNKITKSKSFENLKDHIVISTLL